MVYYLILIRMAIRKIKPNLIKYKETSQTIKGYSAQKWSGNPTFNLGIKN